VKNSKLNSLDPLDQGSLSEREKPLEAVEAEVPTDDTQLELTDDDMPSIESLNAESDYSGFMSPKVSETLRHRALHKLFHLPHYNITDGLNDYDEDYTNFAKLGNVITHEMRRMMELEEQLSKNKADHEQIKQDANSEVVACSEHNDVSEHVVKDEALLNETKVENELPKNAPTDA
jgi:hypothetical protein